MSKLVLHLFHADPASMSTVPMLAQRLHVEGQAAKPALESAAVALPRFTAQGATVVTF